MKAARWAGVASRHGMGAFDLFGARANTVCGVRTGVYTQDMVVTRLSAVVERRFVDAPLLIGGLTTTYRWFDC